MILTCYIKLGIWGRILQNGEIEILGRLDDQIKIRGIRIELNDIKKNLLDHSGVKDAVVIAKEDDTMKNSFMFM